MTVTAAARGGIDIVHTASGDLSTAKASAQLAAGISYENGTGNGQVSKEFSDTRVVSASSSESLDLAGSLTDALGNTVSFSTIKAIAIKADAANVGNLTIGATGSNAFQGPFADATDGLVLKPGGFFVIAVPNTGWTVTGGTGDLLKVANAGGSDASYSIALLGT